MLAAAHLLREILDDREGRARALRRARADRRRSSRTPEKRREADEQLAELATTLKDTPRAIAAYERLLATPARAKALAALAPLYEASGDPEKHARLLEEQAKDETDDAKARAS